MTNWMSCRKGAAAVIAALWLVAASQPASAQWREDNEAHKDSIAAREFRTAMSGSAADISRDAADSRQANYQDVGAHIYRNLDRNRDSQVSQAEYQSNENSIFDGEDYFTDWDADNSGWLAEDEFTTGVEEAGLFGDWDINADGLIDTNEWTTAGYDSDGLFGDDSGRLGENDSLIGEDEGAL